MAFNTDGITQKENEKFTTLNGAWSLRGVTHSYLNFLDEATSGTDTYLGFEFTGGGWLIKYIDASTGSVMRYATKKNNTTTLDYTTAWTNKASLAYGLWSEAID